MESPLGSIPLNCVDKCLLALDSINEPMLIHVILDLEGEIDHARLNQAILSAQQAHAVMRTILRRRHFKLFREIQEDPGKGVLSVADQAKLHDTSYECYLSSWINQPLNITKEFPLRVLLLRKNELEFLLVFTFHHSAADGPRTLLFVRKVIEHYNNELSRESKSCGDIRINPKGDELLEFAHSQRSRVEHFYMKMISSLLHRFFIAPFSPPSRIFPDKPGRSEEIHFCSGTVSLPESRQIEFKLRSVGITINDMLLAACFRTIEKWNRLHGKVSKKTGIMVPVNISSGTSRHIVSNQVSFISVLTKPEDRADPIKLLRKVSANTAYMLENGIAFSIIYFLCFASRFPLPVMKAIAKFFMITRVYVDTIVLTNLGLIWPKVGSEEPAVSSIGNAKILNVTGLAPVVTPMGLSIATGIYNRNLNFSLTYRPALFSEEKARMFLDLYVEELRNYQVASGGS